MMILLNGSFFFASFLLQDSLLFSLALWVAAEGRKELKVGAGRERIGRETCGTLFLPPQGLALDVSELI